MVLWVLNSGFILQELNRTFITLVSKVDGQEKVENYRPISLCNVIMKVIA